MGYWSSVGSPGESETIKPSSRMSISSEESQNRANGEGGRSEEEVSLEYLRNVILQFLEHKEMRVSSSDPCVFPRCLTGSRPISFGFYLQFCGLRRRRRDGCWRKCECRRILLLLHECYSPTTVLLLLAMADADIVQLTRAAFLSSTPPSKWIMLLRTLQTKEGGRTIAGSSIVGALFGAPSLCASSATLGTILDLYGAFESDLLVEYLRFAILNGLVELSTFLCGFLVEPLSHSLSTYASLAQLAIDIHFATQPVVAVPVSCVQCALAVLRTAFTSQLSPFDRDIVSVSQLAILLLSSLNSSLPVAPSDAAIFWTLASDLLQVYDLPSDMRAALETFTVTLGMVLGADAKSAKEGGQAAELAIAVAKDAASPPTADLNDAGIGLILHNLVCAPAPASHRVAHLRHQDCREGHLGRVRKHRAYHRDLNCVLAHLLCHPDNVLSPAILRSPEASLCYAIECRSLYLCVVYFRQSTSPVPFSWDI